jgi:hypothetical protein
MQGHPGVIEGVGRVVIKFGVLLLGNIRFGPRPQGRTLIDGFGSLLSLVILGGIKLNRLGDMI